MAIRLHNGDCLAEMKHLEDSSIDLILSDPPYGVNFQNCNYNDTWEYVMENMSEWYCEWFRLLKEDCYLVLFTGVKNIDKWISKGEEVGFTFKNIIATRAFNNGVKHPDNNFGFQFQPVLLFSKGKGCKFNKVDFIPTSKEWFNDKRNKNPKPYTYQYPNWINTTWAFATAKRASKNFHPNEKNVDFVKFLVQVLSGEGALVLDPFMGSGTTGIAAQRLNRDFIGMEIDKQYFNIAQERINGVFV